VYKKKDTSTTMDVHDPPNVYYLAGKYDAMSGDIEMDVTVPLK
jgi:hypothetical protein